MKKSIYAIVPAFILLSALIFTNCRQSKVKKIPDVSHIEANVKIERFEKDLFAINTLNMEPGLENLKAKYPDFADFYFETLLAVKDPKQDSASFLKNLKGFLQFPEIRKLYDTCMVLYGDFSYVEEQLNKANQYFQYYFPDRTFPKIYTFISEYSMGILFPPQENLLAIGLDFFLGLDYSVYYAAPLNLPRYITRTLTKEHIATLAMKGLVDDMAGEPSKNQLLDLMIHNGKKLYILDQLVPFVPDSIRLGYTAAQTQWCQENELELWIHFISEDLIYSEDLQKIRKLIDHSPNSPGMPPEAPGQTANWTGWQIVKSYMKRFPETTLEELIELRDAPAFLDKAKYRPR